MRTLFVIIVAIVVLGGGYYWYTNMQAMPAATNVENTSPFGTDADGDNDGDMPGTGMEDGTVPENTPGTNVDVNGSANVSTGTTKSFTVTGSSFKFSPATMTVKKGDTVKITFVNSGGTHDFVIDEFNVRTKQIQGGAQETVTFVANKAGSFEYYCSVGNHRAMGMKGTLTVTE